jgi:hypothetical protein
MWAAPELLGGFAHVLAYKSPKKQFFAQNYLTRYTHETFFEKYVNFQNHYLSHCGVIPVQSFRSHIRPLPHGLGLRCPSMRFLMPFFLHQKKPSGPLIHNLKWF